MIAKGQITVTNLDDGKTPFLHQAYKMKDGRFLKHYPVYEASPVNGYKEGDLWHRTDGSQPGYFVANKSNTTLNLNDWTFYANELAYSDTDKFYPKFEGTYSDYNEVASDDQTKYTWKIIKADDGIGIKSVKEYYAVSASNVTPPSLQSDWSETPKVTNTTNKYLWNYEVYTYSNGDVKETTKRVIGTHGTTGATGATGNTGNGITSVTNRYLATTLATGVTTATSGWTTTVQATDSVKKYLWNYEEILYTNGTKIPTAPVIIGTHGEKGDNSVTGLLTNESITLSANKDGLVPASGFTGAKGIFDVYDGITKKTGSGVDKYEVVSQSNITVSIDATGAYSVTAMPTGTTVLNGHAVLKAVYNGVTIEKQLNVSKSVTGATGATGPQGPTGATGSRGPTGATGTSVSSVTEYYLATSASSGIVSTDTRFTTAIQTMTATNKYLWNYEKINFSDGTSQPTIPVIIGVYGDKGQTGSTGATGRSITSITEHYLATSASSGVTRSTSGWSTTMQPTTEANKYLWNYETVNWSSGTTPTYVEPIIIGVHGAKGPQGATGPKGDSGKDGIAGKDGKGISSTTITYGLSTTDTVEPTNYTSNVPTLVKGQYLWTKTVWKYTDSTTETGYTKTYIAKDGNSGKDGIAGKDGVGISNTKVEYVGSTSGTVTPTSGWNTAVPTVAEGNFLWTRTTWTYTDNTTESGYSVAKMGAKGATGATGSTGAPGVSSYTWIRYSPNADGSSMTPTPAANSLYIGVAITSTNSAPTAYTAYTWALIKGSDGKGINSTVITYMTSTSGTTAPTTGWTSTVPTLTKGQYLWTKTIWTYTDSTTETGYSVSYIAKDGNTGKDGIAGKDGVGISKTTITYAKSTNGTTAPTTGYTTTVPSTNPGDYLWTKTVWTYTDNTTETGYSVGKIGNTGATGATGPQGPKGDRGPQGATGSQGPRGDVGTSITGITEYYLATSASSGVTAITSGWTTSVQTMTATNKYLWNYEKVNFSDGTNQPTVPVIIGVYGDKGATGSTGATGRSITGITEHYLATNLATGVTRSTSGWTTTVQTTTETKRYLWNYETITWSSGTTTTYVEPIVIGVHGLQGPQGATGAQGIQGPPGANGVSQYVHIRYSANSSGNPMTTTPQSDTAYIGMVITTSSTAPTGYASYKWSLFKGPQGSTGPQGIQGPKGANGQTTYTWIRYADTPTSGMNQYPEGKKYIGLAFNKTTQTESSNYSDYKWSLMPQNIEIGGRNLFTNSGNFQNTTNWSGVNIAYEGGVRYLTGSGTLTNIADIPLEPGVEYVFTAKLRFNIAFPIASSTPNHIYVRYPGESAFSALDGATTLISNETQTIPGQWHVISLRFKTKPDTSKIPGLKFHAYTGTTPSVKDILWVKLEKGNIATDWTPALEDARTYKAWANSSDGGADFTRVYPNENLLLESNQSITTSAYYMKDYPLADDTLTATDDVVITLKGALGADRVHFRVYNSGGSYAIGALTSLGNGIYQYKGKWTPTGGNSYLRFYQFNQTGTSSSTIEWIKLERGTTPTIYTTNPSDSLTGSVPKYVGFSPLDSDKPSDYEWIINPEWAESSSMEHTSSQIEQTSKSIMTTVTESFVAEEDYTKYKTDISTQFEQTANTFGLNFKTISETVKTIDGKVDANFEEMSKYIRFEDGNIVLGSSGSNNTLRITQNEMAFMQGGVRVAYFSNQSFYINKGVLVESLEVGGHSLVKGSDGHTSFKYIG